MIEQNRCLRAGPPLSPERIAALEAQLGAALPDDYRRFLLETNGGAPEKAMFRVYVGPAPTWMAEQWRAKWDDWQEAWVDDFFVIDRRLAEADRESPTTTLAFWRAQDWQMRPPDALQIACVSRDDLLLIYLRGPRRGQVHLLCDAYLDAAQAPTPQATAAAIRFVAPSFEAFFSGLYKSEGPST